MASDLSSLFLLSLCISAPLVSVSTNSLSAGASRRVEACLFRLEMLGVLLVVASSMLATSAWSTARSHFAVASSALVPSDVLLGGGLYGVGLRSSDSISYALLSPSMASPTSVGHQFSWLGIMSNAVCSAPFRRGFFLSSDSSESLSSIKFCCSFLATASSRLPSKLAGFPLFAFLSSHVPGALSIGFSTVICFPPFWPPPALFGWSVGCNALGVSCSILLLCPLRGT